MPLHREIEDEVFEAERLCVRPIPEWTVASEANIYESELQNVIDAYYDNENGRSTDENGGTSVFYDIPNLGEPEGRIQSLKKKYGDEILEIAEELMRKKAIERHEKIKFEELASHCPTFFYPEVSIECDNRSCEECTIEFIKGQMDFKKMQSDKAREKGVRFEF